ncbi:MAG: endonuclease/exonuclease/phosphatase family protein [Actinomycetes bacterium]
MTDPEVTASSSAGAALRVVTYNVRALRDSASDVATVLRQLSPDVVLVQEAPRFLRWRSRLAALAREAELFVACGGGTAAGVAVLTSLRVDVDRVWECQLSWERGLHRRALACAALSVAGHRFLAASVHLGLQAGQRARHVHEIQALLGEIRAAAGSEELPLIVAGDLNDTPGSRVWQLFADGGLRDAWSVAPDGSPDTYPSDAAVKRIDGILVDDRVEVLGAGVPELPARLLAAATDHRPVLGRLRIGASGDRS